MDVHHAVAAAELLLPGVEAPEGELDPRWQAIQELRQFEESDPEPLWQFARRWGASDDPDLRTAVATCLLEHLLEYHFEALFPRVEAAVRADVRFADCFVQCWPFGATEEPQNLRRFEALKSSVAAV
jgi:hypothetical protein